MNDYQLTAEEARNITKNLINNELEKVFKLIRLQAANPNGNDYIRLDAGIWICNGYITESCIKELRKRGFDVKYIASNCVSNYTKVSW